MEAPIRGRRGRPRRVLPTENPAVAPSEAAEEAQAPVEVAAVTRPALRPAVRDEDPRAAANRRAAEIMQHLGGLDEGTDDFYIDPASVPDGWTYEWKRKLLLGAEDPSHMVQLLRDGWEPVPLDRDAMHRAMMPSNWKENTIERKGMILMERPLELSQEVREMNLYRARKQVRDEEAQLAGTPDGTLSRDDPRVRPQIKKGWEAMPVPKE